MKSIILVGGEGTRLRPLTYSVVKSMVPVLNRPFIEHVICRLAEHGVDEVVLAMGYKPDSILQYFKHGVGANMRLTYSLEREPLGTAGAVKNAASHVNGTLFVLNGDVFSDIDYTEMLNHHRSRRAKVTIALTRVDDPTKFGVVETGEDGRVVRFTEKPKREEITSHWINAGVYILEPDVLDYIPDSEFYMFERGVFPTMLSQGEPVYGYSSTAYWVDMGTPAKYQQLNNDMLCGKCTSPLHQRKPVSIGAGTAVHKLAHMVQPILIGAECKIEEDVVLIGPVMIGNGCLIRKGAHVENSIIWDNVTIGQCARVINSIIASGANISDKRNVDGLAVNDEAPADTSGKKIELEA